MSKRALAIAGLVVAVVGCSANPEDLFSYRGVVLDADGQPRANATITVTFRPEDVLPLGSPCGGKNRGPPGVPTTRPLTTATTDSQGRYVVDVFRAQLEYQTAPPCIRLELQTGAGASSWIDVAYRKDQTLELPDLKPWKPMASAEDVRVADGGSALIASGHFVLPDHTQDMFTSAWRARVLTADGGAVWESSASLEFDAALLEDFAPHVALRAAIFETVQLVDLKPGALPRGHALPSPGARLDDAFVLPVRVAAPSRGGSCDVATPCPLMDGALEPVSLDGGVVRFHLPQPMRVSRVVVRGVEPVSGQALGSLVLRDVATGARLTAAPSLPRASVNFASFALRTVPDAGVQDLDVTLPVRTVSEVSFFE